MGLVTPLIQYCRVILSRMVMLYLWSVFSRVSNFRTTGYSCLLASTDAHCVSSNVMLLIQYLLYHLVQDSKTFPLARAHQYTSVTSFLGAEVSLSCYGRRAKQSPRATVPTPRTKNLGLVYPRGGMYISTDERSFRSMGQEAGRNFGYDGRIYKGTNEYRLAFDTPGAWRSAATSCHGGRRTRKHQDS